MTKMDTSKATDGELLARFEQGRDQSAFAEVVRRHGPMVLGVAQRNLNGKQDAEDAFQATFLALAKAVSRIRNKESVSAWLHGTARKTASSIRRSSERRSGHLRRMKELATEVKTELSADPAEKIANNELASVLDEEIGKLPVKLRAVVVLCYLEGLTQEAAANQTGVSRSAVREQLSRAKELLKGRLVARGVTVGLSAIAAYLNSSIKANAAMSSSLVADTTSKALLYAAGKSAAEAAASTSITQAANQVMLGLTFARITTHCMVALSLVFFSAAITVVVTNQGTATNQGTTGLLNDDFNGNHVKDSSPIDWNNWDVGRSTVAAQGSK